MRISKLAPSERIQGRWLCHLEDGTILRITENEIVAFGLCSGLELSQEVCFRALDEHFVARTVGVKIRYGDFSTTSIQTTPQDGIYNSSEVYDYARKLFWQRYRGGGVRLLGVGLYQMYEGDEIDQGELFKDDEIRKRRLERLILDMGKSGLSLRRASTLVKDGYDSEK